MGWWLLPCRWTVVRRCFASDLFAVDFLSCLCPTPFRSPGLGRVDTGLSSWMAVLMIHWYLILGMLWPKISEV